MSSSDQATRRKALVALALLPTLMLGGCFRPMLADPGNGAPGLKDRLAAISINPVGDRVGQQIRNKLSFDLTGGGDAPPARYKLAIVTSEIGATALIDALSETPQIDMITLTTDFTLTDMSGKVLFRAKMNTRQSYATSLQRFANTRAQRNAENDAAENMADQIRLRLATWLANNP